ncbi:hypothetical protein CF104_03890 [Aeromonas jandaei]|nr:hypothetical protein CF104_03890 [Aeromonas jandaei]
MKSQRAWDFSLGKKWIGEVFKESAPIWKRKMLDSSRHCMGIQCFTVERLRANKRRHDRMDSLAELEDFLETLDLAPEEGEEIARILEKLRDEVAVQ